MKKIFWILVTMLVTAQAYAQQVYQIRADSVRLHNTPENAELIIENRTRDTLGLLFNKGAGRTEFKKVNLQSLSGGRIAVTGHDTVSVNVTAVVSVDSLWRKGDSIAYRKNNRNYAFFAPLVWNKQSDARLVAPKNGDLMRYNLPLNKWENWTFADTILGRGTNTILGLSIKKNFAIFSNVPYDSVGSESTALGYSALSNRDGVVIGHMARADQSGDAVSLGTKATNWQAWSIAIGPYSGVYSEAFSLALGTYATASAYQSVVMGYRAQAMLGNQNQVAVGALALSRANFSLALGYGAASAGGVAVGYMAQAIPARAVSIGAYSRVASSSGVAIGYGAYTKTGSSMGLFDYEESVAQDSVNLTGYLITRFKGGYELYTDSSLMMKLYSTAPKGTSFTTIHPNYTIFGIPALPQTSRLNVIGSIGLPIQRVSSNYTLTADDYSIVALNSVTLTLPEDVGLESRIYELMNASATSLTVATTSSQKIKNLDSDTATSYALTSGARITVQFDGTDWWIIQ